VLHSHHVTEALDHVVQFNSYAFHALLLKLEPRLANREEEEGWESLLRHYHGGKYWQREV
jgi:hypothetical protein